jgi:hypothetical protein
MSLQPVEQEKSENLFFRQASSQKIDMSMCRTVLAAFLGNESDNIVDR